MTDIKPLRLRWRKTWPEVDNDFVADRPGGGTIGRIYLRDGGGLLSGQWSWFFGATTGVEPTAREAARAIEDLWFEAGEGKGGRP